MFVCCSDQLVVQPVDRYQLESLATGISMLCERIPHMLSTTPLEMYEYMRVCVYVCVCVCVCTCIHTHIMHADTELHYFFIVGCVKLK